MKRLALLAPLAVLLVVAVLFSGEDHPRGTYRKPAPEAVIRKWLADYREKRDLVPGPPEPPASKRRAVDFSGSYRFGRYDYSLSIEQRGDRVTFRSGGVDHQDIGGAFETIGAGRVENGVLRARWWCFDLSRNFANNGGAEIRFVGKGRDRIHVRYYHDADEKIEEGYGVRDGVHRKERLEYRIRIRQPAKGLERPLVMSGTVRGRDGEVLEDAVVMLRHEEESAVRTDPQGRYRIAVKRLPGVLMLSAAAPGYRTAVQAILLQEVRPIDFVLDSSPHGDDLRYRFVDPTRRGGKEIWSCGNCHRNSYEEWGVSRHSLTAKSAVTRAVYRKDFLPALARGEASGDKGLCAACHAPQAALDGAEAVLDEVEGTALLGNHCDFCHKVHHVEEIEAPGVRGSLALGRPAPDDSSVPGPIKRIYGPLADSDYLFMGPVYSPLFGTSVLCAGCHQYTTPQGLPALDTYREWRAWAKDRPQSETCQSCHMPSGVSMEGASLARRICVNALRRPQKQIHDHSFLGRDLALGAVELTVQARRDAKGGIEVTTRVVSKGVGHKLPTGSADKHLLLVVVARDAQGKPLALLEGPRIPDHAGGSGHPLELDAGAFRRRLERGEFAGLAGTEFAQVLADARDRTHVPFWRAVRLVEDTRLVPGHPRGAFHRFASPPKGKVKLRVEVIHRLRFKRGDVVEEGIKGPGVRPRDLLLALESLELP